jgi:hypothetical protein
MENIDFDKLLHDVIENPELLLDSKNITNEQIIELQKRMNPYIGLSEAYDPDNKQIAVCSYTNLREDYIRRFTMTSLVGFIFQMLHEYDVPKEKRVWIPESNESKEMFNISNIKEQLQGIVSILEEAEIAERRERELQQKVNTSDLCDEKIDDNDVKEVYNQQQKKTGLLYTITHMLRDIGLIADAKLKVTTESAIKFPEVKEIIKTKKHTKVEFAEREFPNNNAKEIIDTFLKQWLSFDPSIHIRSGLNSDVIKTESKIIAGQQVIVDVEDPSHLTIEEIRRNLEPKSKEDKEVLDILLSSNHTLNAARNIIRDENVSDAMKYAINNSEIFKHYLLPIRNISTDIIPPQDTFHRWSYFTEVNYEELRTITETLYPDKPDLDWAIAIWTTFKGNDVELEEQFTNYCQKHNDSLPSIMKALEIGKWSLLADFKENRKNVQFYNKHTEVLKKIIERHTEDKKIGTELMRNRVRQAKAKNIAEQGPDAPGLKAYKATMSGEGKDLTTKGVERVITPEEMKRLEKAQGNIKAAKELEVIDEYEKLLQGLDDIKKYRDLTDEELGKYNRANEYLIRAKEMINVPDNAIQVDVFTTDAKTGSFNKTHFYTKCEEALEDELKFQK